MESDQIVDSILETVRTEMMELVESESTIKCSIEYELKVLEIARTVAKNLVLGSQRGVPKSRNTKKKS